MMRCLDLAALETFAERLAKVVAGSSLCLYLQGELGAGKTTLARYLLHALGHPGAVKSPSYGILERYALASGVAYHLDLYRLADPEELEFIGLRDLLDEQPLLLVEWPEHGAGVLPAADVVLELQACCEGGRDVAVIGASIRGSEMIDSLVSN